MPRRRRYSAVENPADAANAILGGLLLAVLGRAMTGADPTDPRFRQHLADQMLHGVMTGGPPGQAAPPPRPGQ